MGYDIEILNTLFKKSGLTSESTQRQYHKGINNYVCYFNEEIGEIYQKQLEASLKDKAVLREEYEEKFNQYLVNEVEQAKKEIKTHKNPYETTFYKKLIEYHEYLYNHYESKNTAKNYYNKIHNLFNWLVTGYEVKKPLKTKAKTNKKEPIDEDIPTREMIKEVVDGTNNKKHKAVILFMASSGTAKKETIELTIKDFLEATKEYYDIEINNQEAMNILNLLDEINNKEFNVIPCFKMVRHKTQKFYYGFCSPESVKYILDYLLTEYKNKEIDINNKLFNLNSDGLDYVFRSKNEKYDYGVGYDKKNIFRCHNMRRTQIREATLGETNKKEITNFFDHIQGRETPSVYTAINKEDEKKTYIKYLPKLTFLEDYRTKDEIVSSEKYQKLKKENEELQEDFNFLSTQNRTLSTRKDRLEEEKEELKDKLENVESKNEYLIHSLRLSTEINNINVKGIKEIYGNKSEMSKEDQEDILEQYIKYLKNSGNLVLAFLIKRLKSEDIKTTEKEQIINLLNQEPILSKDLEEFILNTYYNISETTEAENFDLKVSRYVIKDEYGHLKKDLGEIVIV